MDIETALQQLRPRLEDYIQEYITSNSDDIENINLKKNHTFRVRDAILDIGKSIGLNEEEMSVAETCALLHDIGRFEQYRKYGTFQDSASENHAALGVRIIRKLDLLKNFHSDAQKNIIRTVGCHNMFSIPGKNNKEWIRYLKLVRDADKIDIFYVVTEYYNNYISGTNKTLELNLPDTPDISDAVYEPIINGKTANIKDLASLNDFKLYQMGWAYDLYFNRSYEIMKEKAYLKKLRNALPESSEKADAVYKKTELFVEEKLNSLKIPGEAIA